ncbi:MAG: DUF6291 domain-containing protein [Oscillospiraceae bacterium]|nr:DUF6291 domain-containing protein [Oscillospiraceae bacterium]
MKTNKTAEQQPREALLAPGIMLYRKELHILQKHLTAEEVGQLVLGLLDYTETGEIPQVCSQNNILGMAFIMMADVVDRDNEKYVKKVEKNRKNAQARWEKVYAAEEPSTQEKSSEYPTPLDE